MLQCRNATSCRSGCRPARWGKLPLWMGLIAVAVCWGTAAPEYQVKAVFLFNFAQFVEWPAGSFQAADAPFVIGVLGQDPFGAQLDAVARGETVGQRPLAIRRYRSIG